MNAVDINEIASAVGRVLRTRRSAIMREDRIHDAIADAFTQLRIEHVREHRLTAESRLDFFLSASGTAVEVKKGNASIATLPQIGRYFESPEVTGCLLIAMRIHHAVPRTFAGKPIAQLALWKFLL